MKKLPVLLLTLVFVLAMASPALAHNTGGTFDAPTLAKQAIVLLQGNKDIDTIQMKLDTAKKEGGLDNSQIDAAETAVTSGNLAQAVNILVALVAKTPEEQAAVQTLHSNFGGTATEYAFLTVGIVAILLGFVLVGSGRKAKPIAAGHAVHH